MTSRGAGKRRRWGYAWVFLVPAIVVLPFMLLSSLGPGVELPYWALGDLKSTVIFALTMPMIIAYLMVRIYYGRQAVRRAESLQDHIQNSERVK